MPILGTDDLGKGVINSDREVESPNIYLVLFNEFAKELPTDALQRYRDTYQKDFYDPSNKDMRVSSAINIVLFYPYINKEMISFLMSIQLESLERINKEHAKLLNEFVQKVAQIDRHYDEIFFHKNSEEKVDLTERLQLFKQLYDKDTRDPLIKDLILIFRIRHALVICDNKDRANLLSNLFFALLRDSVQRSSGGCEILLSRSEPQVIDILNRLIRNNIHQGILEFIDENCPNDRELVSRIMSEVMQFEYNPNVYPEVILQSVIEILSNLSLKIRDLISSEKSLLMVLCNIALSKPEDLIWIEASELFHLMPRWQYTYTSYLSLVKLSSAESKLGNTILACNFKLTFFMKTFPMLFGQFLPRIKELRLISFGALIDGRFNANDFNNIQKTRGLNFLAFNCNSELCNKKTKSWEMYTTYAVNNRNELDKLNNSQYFYSSISHLFYLMRALILSHTHQPCLQQSTFVELCETFVNLMQMLDERNLLVPKIEIKETQKQTIEIELISELMDVVNCFNHRQCKILENIEHRVSTRVAENEYTRHSLKYLAGNKTARLYGNGMLDIEETVLSHLASSVFQVKNVTTSALLSQPNVISKPEANEKARFFKLSHFFLFFKPQQSNKRKHIEIIEDLQITSTGAKRACNSNNRAQGEALSR